MTLRISKSSLFLTTLVLFSSPTFACQDIAGTTTEKQAIAMNFKELQLSNPIAHNIRNGHCQAVSLAQTDGALMDFLPSNEEWQGLFTDFRAKGDKPVQALVHVYEFMSDLNE